MSRRLFHKAGVTDSRSPGFRPSVEDRVAVIEGAQRLAEARRKANIEKMRALLSKEGRPCPR